MPVSLEDIMKGFSPEERERIERNAELLATEHRAQALFADPDPGRRTSTRAAVGTRVGTGDLCPESGIWRVEDVAAATVPIAVHAVMPSYRNQAVTWILMRHA